MCSQSPRRSRGCVDGAQSSSATSTYNCTASEDYWTTCCQQGSRIRLPLLGKSDDYVRGDALYMQSANEGRMLRRGWLTRQSMSTLQKGILCAPPSTLFRGNDLEITNFFLRSITMSVWLDISLPPSVVLCRGVDCWESRRKGAFRWRESRWGSYGEAFRHHNLIFPSRWMLSSVPVLEESCQSDPSHAIPIEACGALKMGSIIPRCPSLDMPLRSCDFVVRSSGVDALIKG